jgi:Sulfotransferase family
MGSRRLRASVARIDVRARRPSGLPELVITGISRSGTSYMCNLLDRFDNCAAVNEPLEVLYLLRRQRIPWGLPLYYRTTRRRILAGKPIENRIFDGEVVSDTFLHEGRHPHLPTVVARDFVLAVKNTREFLFRLPAIRRVMPAARVVVCVRNPFDTIASWKASFPHLRDADVMPFLRHGRRMWLPSQERAALAGIAATPHLAERRAKWWRFQAERVLENRDAIVLVNYDDLVHRPMTVLSRVLEGNWAGTPRRPITPSAARSRRDVLDEDDQRAIRAICSQAAAELELGRAGLGDDPSAAPLRV